MMLIATVNCQSVAAAMSNAVSAGSQGAFMAVRGEE